ncbi:MAG TPA: hypothetical protein VKB14_08985 [Actinomycetales bacterium]|nr:hypothetical protein [Actinomycetales bacterium]
MARHDPDRTTEASLAQAGVVARWQAIAEGWTSAEVAHRVRAGRWRALHPGVYVTSPARWRGGHRPGRRCSTPDRAPL